MAKAQQLRAVDEPNVVLPLASSYNERGVAGYTHTVTNSEDQRKINCFYELAKNPVTGKGTLTLSKRPGVVQLAATTIGSASQTVYFMITLLSTISGGKQVGVGASSPWVVNVSGSNIRVSNSSTSTNVDTMGTHIPGYIDKTSISGVENIVLQVRPIAYSSAHRVWFSTAIATWTQITDADFTGLIHRGKMEHMDGFAFIMSSDNKIWNSASNKLDDGSGNSWLNTNFISKQIVQDSPVGLARLSNKILAFGDDTVEMFYNAGNTVGSPLGRIPQQHQKIGLIIPDATDTKGHYYAIASDSLYFVGRYAGGKFSSGVFAYNGTEIGKVSIPYIDKILNEVIYSSTGFSSVNTVDVNGQQAISILLTLPNVATQRWLMYFPAHKEWFEWTSSVFSPVGDGKFYLPCTSGAKDVVYYYDATDTYQDAGTSYAWSTQFRLPTNGSSLNYLGMYGVDADTDTSANDLTVSISTDDCATFSTLGTIDQTQDRKVVIGGGSFRKAHIRLGNTNARPTRIHNFLAGLD